MATKTTRAATAKNPQAELQKVLTHLEKQLGTGTIHKGSESEKVNHLPFLEPNLNHATEGGAPFGRFMALYGDESTGKTRIALELIAQLQKLPASAEVVILPRIAYHRSLGHDEIADRLESELEWIREAFPDGGEAVYYNAEQQYDPIWAQKIGVDTDRLLLIESNTIEDIVEAMENLYAHYAMHVVDSTSSASSMLSQKEDVGKSLMGTDARQWKVCLRDSMRLFDPNRNIGVLVHQMSTNIRTGGSSPVSSRFLRHTSSCSILFQRGKFLWEKGGVLVEDKPTGADEASMAGRAVPDGVEVYATIEKSRTCRPRRIAGMQWNYKRSCFMPLHDLATAGLYFGLVTQSGSWYAIVGEESNLGQGMKCVYERLAEDGDLRDAITNRLMDYTGGS
jgi:recombination protein RecA